MPKNRVNDTPGTDPTLPSVELTIGKQTFYLAFSFRATAEKNLRDIGVKANLLHALDLSNLDAERFVPLLYAALITHQPKINIEKVAALVTFRSMGTIFEKIAEAYAASMAEPSDEDKQADPDQPE
jgi:hypothetical protein